MEARKTKELRVRLRRVKGNSSSVCSSPSTGKVRAELPSSSKRQAQPGSCSASDSDVDDYGTVHFKLAAAQEPGGAPQATGGHLFDWQSMKNALISEAQSAFRSKSSSAAKKAAERADDVADTDLQESESTDSQSGAYVKPRRRGSDSSSTSSSDEDDDVPDILLVSPEPNADVTDTDRSMLLSKLPFSDPGVSVVDDKNPTIALSKILSLPPFDPHAPHLQVQLIIKSVVSLTQLSMREDNLIEVEIKKSFINEFATGKIDRALSPFMDFPNILVKHSLDEFFTFCSCKNCVKYREIVIHIMVEQFKTAHMVVMLLDVLIKAYGPMLKNVTAYNKFEKLLDANKEIYWIACGFVYNKKAEHMDFIYDESLSDNMIFVLFSSILMVNNPLLLLQILAFHVECIVKAYAEGFLEIVEPDNNKIPAEEMLTYILDGYDDLCRISEQIACYLFAFENDFLRKFSLTWTLLCQRLYQQHVYANLTDTMLACIITLKEDELTSRHVALIKKYIQFDDKMNYVERRWTDVWIELNKFNLSDAERKRRKCLLDVHRIFDTVVQDAIAFSLQEFDDDNDFYDFQCLENRRLAWQNIMAYTKMKWPDGFFEPPNTLVVDDKCKKCCIMLEYHAETCKCITCSIAGGPLPPRRNPDSTCYKCLAHSLVEKEVNLYESKILNVCASDDFLTFMKSNGKRKGTTLEELGEEVCASLPPETKIENTGDTGQYHLAWAVFHHFNNRKRYRHATLDEKYFCKNCRIPACLLARKILNNEISQPLSLHLVRYYQPLSMSREELRAILPNIMLYNRKMIAFNIGFDLTDVHDLVVKIYWTFIISLYATYFMEFDEKCPLNLNHLEIANNDIRLNTDALVGNKDDTKFVQFLDKIKSLSPFKSKVESDFAFTVDVHTEEIQTKLDKLLNIHENQLNPPFIEKIPPPATNVEAVPTTEDHPKRNCKEKSKKCCFDHSDMGDHCKENHSSKKRIKKECNHARMNETRDRLRKKLSQLVNARKNMKAGIEQQNTATAATATTLTPNTNTKQPPSLKSVATAAAAASSKANTKSEEDDDSLVCLSTLCKRISHLHTSKTQGNSTASPNATGKKVSVAGTPVKKIANNGSSAKDGTPTVSNNNNGNRSKQAEIQNTGSTNTPDKAANDMDILSVYLNYHSREFLDNYSRDQSKVRKWINETLSYIEGSGTSGNGKKQPQPTNPKKAAKKAKQKQRKEEEKRIAELHDFRAQFHDIYFKEFVDKHKLKALKASKKRDKKQIADLETNIKKLQRAKAKVETVILELIATVKQTNSEFKFPYLPTKEQQQEKLREMEAPATTPSNAVSNVSSAGTATAAQYSSEGTIQGAGIPVAPATMASNNLTPGALPPANYSMPYGHTNLPSFPYHIDFQAQGTVNNAGAYGMIHPPLPTPMCYAPPPQQTLSPDVVAAMAANAACSSNSDPSKRIVTIRRVNLPNVPEPQVTVTAKGSSPDKDKLLYTFVNGQLVPTGGPAPPMTQLPIPSQIPLSLPVQPPHLANVPEHLISIPPPPLSKTQMKKERRRQTKLAAEQAKAAAEAEELRLEQERELQLQREKQKAANKNSKVKADEKAKKKGQQALQKKTKVEQLDVKLDADSKQKKQKKKNAGTQSVSITSVSTAEATEATKPGKHSNVMQHRSASTTTSCSAVTSSSATPISSQVNTRDNSVCSLKPNAPGKKGKQKEQTKEKPKVQTQTQKQAQQKQQQQQPQQQKKGKQTHQQPAKDNTKKVEASVEVEIKAQPAQVSIVPLEGSEPEKCKKERKKRPKLVDNGQFDNNPFKSLHMQDSESDWDSDSSYDEICEEKQPEVVVSKVVAEPTVKSKMIPEPVKKLEPIPQVKETSVKSTSKRLQQETNNVKPAKSVEPSKKQPQHQQQQQQQSQPQSKVQSSRDQKRGVQPKVKGAEAQPSQSRRADNKASQQEQLQPPRLRSSKQHQQQHQPAGEVSHTAQQSQPTRNRGGGVDSRHQNSAVSSGKRGNASVAGGRFERNQNASVIGSAGGSSHGERGNGRNSNRHAAELTQTSGDGNPLSKRAQKQALRNKKFQKQQHSHTNNYDDGSSGIPNNMGYFNASEVMIPPAPRTQQSNHHPTQHMHQQQQQQQPFNSLTQQMQGLHLGSGDVGAHYQQAHNVPSYASVSNNYHKSTSTANISIMDQLNRGVQVENLSLPPGITLTKVDPVKSEQLRQKSESIRKLSKPLQPQPTAPKTFHHPGATIIAPPVAPVSNYYGAPYAGVAAAAALDHSGIIMVEAQPSGVSGSREQPKVATAAPSGSGKSSKNKKRRNKSKQEGNARAAAAAASTNAATGSGTGLTGVGAAASNAANQTKMITLRNPMFHGGAASAAATILQQQPSLLPGRPLGGLPLPTSLPMDQPAAIIKNENGMFTIRNPALHQAVTNGLALGGYRQFGNVSYYTPQEAAAEAARATQQSATAAAANEANKTNTGANTATTAFSYFSNNTTSTSAPSAAAASSGAVNNTHNTISISCTSIDGNGAPIGNGGGGLTGEAAVIARPSPSQKCISAIGSEIKNAQQQKQKSKEQDQWASFVQEMTAVGRPQRNATDSLNCGATAAAYLGGAGGGNGASAGVGNGSNNVGVGGAGVCLTTASLQEKYQQSSYYNGFDVFPATSNSSQISSTGGRSSNTGSLFDSADCHMHHHNCGEDSPPPTITSFNSYLDGIPNTGVIRYDDASFLKNLIPGQNLNNEVSIHNVNDSNFTRSTTSPVAHRVEITPVYGSRPTSTNTYEHCTTANSAVQQSVAADQHSKFMPNTVTNYRENLADYSNDANSIFAPNNLVNLNELDANVVGSANAEADVETYKCFGYDFEHTGAEQQHQQKAMLDLNDLLIKKSAHSQRTSPYLDEATMESFVQNINSLQISASPEEQCAQQLNINGNSNSSGGGSSGGAASSTATTNGWW